MMMRLSLSLAWWTLAASAASAAPEVVHLRDGTRLVGELLPANSVSLRIITLDGEVEIASADAVLVEGRTRLRRSLAATQSGLVADDWRGLLQLSHWAMQKGLYGDALATADAALVIARSRNASAEVPAGLFALPIDRIRRDQAIDVHAAWRLVQAIGDADHPASAAVAAGRLLERAAIDDLSPALLKAATHDSAPVRKVALEALGIARPGEAYPTVLARMLFDADAQVRGAAIDAARNYADAHTAQVLGKAVLQADPALRATAMDAIDRLGETRTLAALTLLLRRGPLGGPGGVYVADVEQRAFVQDFDVDVANSAFIANPNIGVLQSGRVLQTSVLGSTPSISATERARIAALIDRLGRQAP